MEKPRIGLFQTLRGFSIGQNSAVSRSKVASSKAGLAFVVCKLAYTFLGKVSFKYGKLS